MVQIGNYNLDWSLGGVIGKMASYLFWGLLILLATGVFVWLIYRTIRNKTAYVHPITLVYIYENGTMKDNPNLRGGKFVNRAGVWDYRIKVPKQFRKKELGYMPDFSKADSDGRLYFTTFGDGTLWQQCEKNIVAYETKNGKRYSLLIKPIPTDIKQATVNSIKNWRETIDKSKLTAFGIAIGAFIIMVIAHLISLYIQTKIKCPV